MGLVLLFCARSPRHSPLHINNVYTNNNNTHCTGHFGRRACGLRGVAEAPRRSLLTLPWPKYAVEHLVTCCDVTPVQQDIATSRVLLPPNLILPAVLHLKTGIKKSGRSGPLAHFLALFPRNSYFFHTIPYFFLVFPNFSYFFPEIR